MVVVAFAIFLPQSFLCINVFLNGFLTDSACRAGKVAPCPQGGQFQQDRELFSQDKRGDALALRDDF